MQHAWWLVALALAACNGSGKDEDPNDDADADTDADSDSDSDADTDTDPPVDADADGFASDVDCDDADDAVFPGAPDLCGDDRVTDCDRDSDEGLVTLDGTQGFDGLAAALAVAVADSEILLCPGLYEGAFVATVPVRLVPFGDPTSIVLDGIGAGTTLSVPPGSEIVGLTIIGGDGPQSGGGILLTGEGDLLVQDCIVERNEAQFGGGLAIGANSVATVVNTVFDANDASQGGGGVSVGPGSVLDLGTSSVTGNTAELYGGGVFLDGGSLVGGLVDGNTLSSFVEVLYEEGILAIGDPAWGGAGVAAVGTASVTGTEISGNVASDGGGGLSITFGDLTVVDAAIHDNRAYFAGGFGAIAATLQLLGTTEVYENDGYAIGGGVALLSTLTGGVVRDNTAQDYAGGIAPWDSVVEGTFVSSNFADGGGGVFPVGEVTLREVSVIGNFATSGGGIGSRNEFTFETVDSLTIEDSLITDNEAIDGGGLYTVWPTTITGTTIADNTALLGGGLLIDRRSVTISGGFVVRNQGTEGGGGIWMSTNTTLDVTATDLGTGADDNDASDVHTGGIELTGYGASATFTCDDLTCTPPP